MDKENVPHTFTGMAMCEEACEKAQAMGEKGLYDEAARFLGTYRKLAHQALDDASEALSALLCIIQGQCRMFIYMEDYGRAMRVAEWFFHILHDKAALGGEAVERLKLYREHWAMLYFDYAKALIALDRMEEAHAAIRNALDTTKFLIPSVLKAVQLIRTVVKNRKSIGDVEVKEWALQRFAEYLAQLDFAGLHQSVFRQTLDNLQFAWRQQALGEAVQIEQPADACPHTQLLLKMFALL